MAVVIANFEEKVLPFAFLINLPIASRGHGHLPNAGLGSRGTSRDARPVLTWSAELVGS
jgi:hypothetical protein